MSLLGSIYNLRNVLKHYQHPLKLSVLSNNRKPYGMGKLRIISIRELNGITELIVAYEDYCR